MGDGKDRFMNVLTSALDALAAESSGLEQLRNAMTSDAGLRQNFEHAVTRVLAMSGRLIVSGIGKSGHIGRKIQATLASTGTPSLFLHAAEAAHGDLGMIGADDVMLLISHSGESRELIAVAEHAAQKALTTIAMTGQPNSSLAQLCQTTLALPSAAEACPMGLAPTTSTLMQLALGDAFAIALLNERHFSAHDFGAFHPGGKLGSALRPIAQLMHVGDAMPLGPPEMPLADVIVEMTRKTFGCMGVVDAHNTFLGLISDGDLRPALTRGLDALKAQDIMNKSPLTTSQGLLAQQALELMTLRERPVTSLFVLDDASKPIGILHLHDLLRASRQ